MISGDNDGVSFSEAGTDRSPSSRGPMMQNFPKASPSAVEDSINTSKELPPKDPNQSATLEHLKKMSVSIKSKIREEELQQRIKNHQLAQLKINQSLDSSRHPPAPKETHHSHTNSGQAFYQQPKEYMNKLQSYINVNLTPS